MGPFGDTSIITTAMDTYHVDPGRFSSRCCAFRRTHTRSANPIRLLCIRLALPLTLSLLSRFAPSTRLIMVGVPPRALWLAGAFLCDCTFWDDRRGGLSWQPLDPLVGTATITTVTSTNRVDLGSFSSRCCTFRRTHTSTDPTWLLCIRLDSRLTLFLPSQFAPRVRLTATSDPMTGGDFLAQKEKMCWCSRDTHRLGVERVGGQNNDTTATVRCTV